jgi:hypothetical protein
MCTGQLPPGGYPIAVKCILYIYIYIYIYKTTDREIKDILHGADFVRLLKSLRPRCYGHVERMLNQRMSKQTATATMEGTMKSGRPRKRWTECTYNGNLKKRGQAVVTD